MATALSFVDGLWTRCCSLADAGQHSQARMLLQRLLHLELPASLRSEAALMLADMLRLQGEYQHARQHVSAALAGDPHDASLHHMLGYLHDEDDENGSERRALTHLKAAFKLAPDSGECHRALGEFLFEHAEQKRGLALLRKAVKLEPGNLDNLRSLIRALVASELTEQARQLIREEQFRAGRNHPSVQSLWNELSYATALKQQQDMGRLSTVPLLKTVSRETRLSKPASSAAIIRFDAAHGLPLRPSRRPGTRPRKN